jgi:carbon storage regulator CsrA
MLVLTRRKGETITVITGNGDIQFTILDVERGSISVGIDAPRRFPVHRKEVQDRIAAGEPARRG